MEFTVKAAEVDKRRLCHASSVFKQIPLVIAQRIVHHVSPIDVKSPEDLLKWLTCFPLTYARIYIFVDSIEKWSKLDRLRVFFNEEKSSTVTSTGTAVVLDINLHCSPMIQGIPIEGLELFTKAVNVTHLQLKHRGLAYKSSQTIAKILANGHRNQKHILSLGFGSDQLSYVPELPRGREALLATLVDTNHCLLYLEMNRSGLCLQMDLKHQSMLFRAVSVSKLAYLRLVDAGLDARGAIALAGVVATHRYLKLLELSENRLTDQGVVALAKGVERNACLECVGLLTVDMTGIGGCALARALRAHPKLKVLILKDDTLGVKCGAEFASMLQVNTSLKTLVLSYSQLDAGCSYFVKALELNRELRSLRLSYSGVRAKDKVALVRAALQGGTLELLEFEDENVLNKHSQVPFPIIEYLHNQNVSI